MREHLQHPQTLFLACLCSLLWPLPMHGQEVAPPAPPTFCHVDSTFVQALYGKSRREALVLLGQPCHVEKTGMMYLAKVPTLLGECDGYLLIFFAGDKARSFQLNTGTPLNSTFVRLVLQNSPGARFEPSYEPSNLTGSDWTDKRIGFHAFTTQMSEREFLLTVDLTLPNERATSPLWQKEHDAN